VVIECLEVVMECLVVVTECLEVVMECLVVVTECLEVVIERLQVPFAHRMQLQMNQTTAMIAGNPVAATSVARFHDLPPNILYNLL